MYRHNITLFFSIIFTSFLLLITLTVFLYIKYPPYKQVEYWIKEAIILKERYLNTITKPKIIIFSGSNSLFSICTPLLKEKTHHEIVNFGLTLNLPLEIIFKLIENYAESNDIILLPLEYPHYFRDKKLSQKQIDVITTCTFEYIRGLPITEITRIILPSIPRLIKDFNGKKIHIRTYEEYIKNKNISALLAKSTPYKDSFNIYGDMLYDDLNTLPENYSYSYFNIEDLKNFRFQQLKVFSKFLAKKNIKLILTYPVSIRIQDFDLSKKEHLKKIEAFNKKCEEYDLELIGIPELSNYDRKFAFDFAYHLNAEGAILRSLYLADSINCYLANKPQEIADLEAYKKQKKAEAKEILHEYRKLGYFFE